MLVRRPLVAVALAAVASIALPACLLQSGPLPSGGGPQETAEGGVAGAGPSGGESVTGGAGGEGGGAGGGNGGGGASGGGTGGGSGGSVYGDVCPGQPVSLSVYSNVQLANLSTIGATPDFKGSCGGEAEPDLVFQVTPKADGYLTVALSPGAQYKGFVYLRSACEDEGSQLDCGDGPFTRKVTKDSPVYVFVDGHDPQPSGEFTLKIALDGCGNSVIDGAEQCDDGNLVSGDGCSSDCLMECDCPSGTDCSKLQDVGSLHCYALVRGPDQSWDGANMACQLWGGTLAILAAQTEIDLVLPLLSSGDTPLWIGATDLVTEGEFAWQNGETFNYQNGDPPWNQHFFPPDEPNGGADENCLEIYDTGNLNDNSCSQIHDYLCERAPKGAPPSAP